MVLGDSDLKSAEKNVKEEENNLKLKLSGKQPNKKVMKWVECDMVQEEVELLQSWAVWEQEYCEVRNVNGNREILISSHTCIIWRLQHGTAYVVRKCHIAAKGRKNTSSK